MDSLKNVPHINVTETVDSPLRKRSFKQRYFAGRFFALRVFIAGVVLSIAFNIILLAIASSHTTGIGLALLTTRTCDSANRLNKGLNVLINTLNVSILTGIGAFATIVTSPTREEVEKAHTTGDTLDIGSSSFRNILKFRSKLRVIYILLLVLGLPLHLIGNSVLIQRKVISSYAYIVGSESFLAGKPFSLTNFAGAHRVSTAIDFDEDTNLQIWDSRFRHIQDEAYSYTELSPADCIQHYTRVLPAAFNHVIAITADVNSSSSIFYWDVVHTNGDGWACDNGSYANRLEITCDKDNLVTQAASGKDWVVLNHTISRCLAKPIAPSCDVLVNINLTSATIVLECAILSLMLYVLIGLSDRVHSAWTVWGDLAASFLEKEDPHSRGMCFAAKEHILKSWYSRGKPASLELKPVRWISILSYQRKVMLGIFLGGGVALMAACVGYMLFIVANDRGASISLSNLRKLGFGEASTSYSFLGINSSYNSISQLSLLRNLPQLFLAVITMTTNAALIEMTQANHYSGFAHSRKPLRVSTPAGIQRGTYLLSMPYRYALPLQLSMVGLHWTMSQSLVLLYERTSAAFSTGREPLFIDTTNDRDVYFSPLAIITSCCTGAVIALALLALGFQRIKPGMPLASNCSLALSAAMHYHPVVPDGDAAFKPLQWGVCKYMGETTNHCSFSSEDVDEPKPGWQYI